MVPVVGVEPTRPKAQHFECCVSTNSTTPAARASIAVRPGATKRWAVRVDAGPGRWQDAAHCLHESNR